MNATIEFVEMLITRLSNIEEILNTKLDKKISLDICPCWISNIEFFPDGTVKLINCYHAAKLSCKRCFPKE